MSNIIFISAYFAFGFLFMTMCARKGWMEQYDPALMYLIAWPAVILVACFRIFSKGVLALNSAVDNYVNTLKPNNGDTN